MEGKEKKRPGKKAHLHFVLIQDASLDHPHISVFQENEHCLGVRLVSLITVLALGFYSSKRYLIPLFVFSPRRLSPPLILQVICLTSKD